MELVILIFGDEDIIHTARDNDFEKHYTQKDLAQSIVRGVRH